MKTLHLVLKGHWYDKIASGEKVSEYRACTPYWNDRFCGGKGLIPTHKTECHIYERVVFHRGYTATTMEFKIKYIKTTTGPNDLNLGHCWKIKLGRRIK